jgi:hypothetical protein
MKLAVTVLLSTALALTLAACARVITHEPPPAFQYDSVTEQNATYRSVPAPQDRPAYEGSYYAKARFDGNPNPTGESHASGNQDVNVPDGYAGYYGAAFYFPVGTFSGANPAQQGSIDVLRWQSKSGDFGGIRIAGDHLARLIKGNPAHGPPADVANRSFSFEEGCWNWAVVRQGLSRTAGQAINEVTLNGQKVVSSTSPNNYSGRGADQVRFGLPYIDQEAQKVPLEFYVDNAYLGASNDAPPAPLSNSCSSKDRIPPKFAGLKSATTCIPGPIGGGRTTSYHLGWDPATDDVTPSSEIVYDIYQATTPGGEDFSTPTYTTSAGATTFDSPPLPTDESFYFVVRARDQAGNRDSNTVERQGENLCE